MQAITVRTGCLGLSGLPSRVLPTGSECSDSVVRLEASDLIHPASVFGEISKNDPVTESPLVTTAPHWTSAQQFDKEMTQALDVTDPKRASILKLLITHAISWSQRPTFERKRMLL
jgi:hypothetical protein